MATRTRQPIGTRRKPVRRPPRRTLTVTFGPADSTRHTRRRPSWSWRFVRWGARWTGRAAAWTGRQAIRRTAGHVSRARTAWREWADIKAEHGRDPVVTDLFTGKVYKAREVKLDAPTGGDPEVRAQQDEDTRAVRERINQQRIDRMLAHRARPPWWERKLIRLGLRDRDRAWAPHEESLRARFAVMAQIRDQQAREAAQYRPAPSAEPTPTPEPVPGNFTGRRKWRSTHTQGDGSMANPVRQWSDLAEPDIDPFEFPQELPEHFAEVRGLLTEEATEIEAAADKGKEEADIFANHVEYLNSADVKSSVISPIADASEEINNAFALLRQVAEAMSRAASLVEQAQRAAESEYGDFEMPRFDKANAG